MLSPCMRVLPYFASGDMQRDTDILFCILAFVEARGGPTGGSARANRGSGQDRGGSDTHNAPVKSWDSVVACSTLGACDTLVALNTLRSGGLAG